MWTTLMRDGKIMGQSSTAELGGSRPVALGAAMPAPKAPFALAIVFFGLSLKASFSKHADPRRRKDLRVRRGADRSEADGNGSSAPASNEDPHLSRVEEIVTARLAPPA